MKNLQNSLASFGEKLQPFLLLAMRLFWGYNFFVSGLGKLMNPQKVAGFFAQLDIPLPELSAYLAGGAEFLGGALLIMGLFTRLAVIPLAFTMTVAYLTAHREALLGIFQNPANFIREAPFTYLFVCLLLFAFGAGKLSLDYLLHKK